MVKPHLISHTVQLGDTLEILAIKYQTDREEIKEANRLKSDALTLEKLLLIPVSQELFEKMLSE
ncbi:MAG TPA: LysM peptidoglycan-binding domain-containing protein [Sulfurovum sp.]|nr:LysM peptidoglycan-binding domain-containing protein [Sulfurovum sp.]